MRIAGNLPLLPQRLMVRGETLKISATSRTVSKSGKSSSLMDFLISLISSLGLLISLYNLKYHSITELVKSVITILDRQSSLFSLLTWEITLCFNKNMALTQKDFDRIEELTRGVVKEEIKNLPTKEEFFSKMDESMGEKVD